MWKQGIFPSNKLLYLRSIVIKEHQVLQILIQSYPQARATLVDSADDWISENGSISSHALLSAVVHRVTESFLLGEYENSQELFDVIEQFVSEGEESVSNAACTCFIESLLNIASSEGKFTDSHFVSLMGAKSIEYAKSWDAFTGVKTSSI